MLHKEKNVSVSGTIILLLVISNVLILKVAFIQNENWYWALVVSLPLLLIAILIQKVRIKADNKDEIMDIIVHKN